MDGWMDGSERWADLRPDAVLAVGGAREAGGEEAAGVAEVDDFAGLGADVAHALADHAARPRVHDAQLLVLARRRQIAAVAVERHRVDHVRMALDPRHLKKKRPTPPTSFMEHVPRSSFKIWMRNCERWRSHQITSCPFKSFFF